ncbi:hypothetical protein RhiirA5_427428, partial [Rhizophagus irregularis]
PPSGNVQGQGSSASTPSPTSQLSTDNSAKRTRVSSEPIMDQDNILTPPVLLLLRIILQLLPPSR